MVVDEDVDIHNLRAVEIAIRDHADPKDGFTVFPAAPGSPLDPSIPWEDRDDWKFGTGVHNKLLIDATIDWRKHPPRPEYGGKRYPPRCADVPAEIESLVNRRWKEYGL